MTNPAGFERITNNEKVVQPETYDALLSALGRINREGYPPYLTEQLTQREVLVAWVMGLNSICGSPHTVREDVLTINARIDDDKRMLAEKLVSELTSVHPYAIVNAWKSRLNPVIEEAQAVLHIAGFKEGSPQHNELGTLNAVKAMYENVFPKE